LEKEEEKKTDENKIEEEKMEVPQDIKVVVPEEEPVNTEADNVVNLAQEVEKPLDDPTDKMERPSK